VRSICQAQGADLHREPGGEIVGDADEVARFGGAQQQACGIKAAGSDDEGGRGRDNAPGNHDAREPPPRADAVEHQVARDFEQAIGDEQEAGTQAELARGQPNVTVHGQGGKTDDCAVEIVEEIGNGE